ncbi:MAG: hypothetical protein PWQ91_944 [Eubacteriales bacterium]|nr:hypothetical protein [Eubacteriales bacterium]MDN5363883.1 hypothetical protein [Eubacteriales bacterium]
MTDRVFFPGQIIPPQPVEPGKKTGTVQKQQGKNFAAFLAQKIAEGAQLKFSQHALERIRQRGIEITPAEMEKILAGVEKAAQKGAKESLLLMPDKAFIVSIKNRTVITAVDAAGMKENVFTNIDSAVLL